MKKIYGGLIACALCCLVPPGTKAEMQSQFTSHATLAAHSYVPRSGQTVITAIGAESDAAASVVTIQGTVRPGVIVSATPTNGAELIEFTATGIASNDVIIFYHDTSGTMDYLTVTNATATNVTVSGTISEAGTAADRVFEMETQAQYDLGNASLEVAGSLFASPKDSPVRVAVTGSSACFVSTTATLTP